MSSSATESNNSGNIDVTSPYTPRRPSPLVSISINHPIGAALRKVKNFFIHKQTLFSTSFTIKVTPLVALVSFFGVATIFGGGITTAYNFGKTVEDRFLATTPSPTPKVIMQQPAVVTVSRVGTIRATYQLPPALLTPSPVSNNGDGSSSSSSSITTPLPSPTSRPVLHYIFVSQNGTLAYLTANPSVHIQNYLNVRLLVTGNFDSSKNTLFIAKPEDIEVLQ